MSLLSEALKKQQEEGVAPLDVVPREASGSGNMVAARHEWAAVVLVAGGLLVVLLAAGLAVYIWLRSADPVPAPAPAPAVVTPAQPADVPVVVVPAEEEPELPPAPEAPAPVPQPPPAPEVPAAVVWPTFQLQASMQGVGVGSVLIDGEVVPVGGRHRGMLIREITARGVVLEFEGEEQTVRPRSVPGGAGDVP
jgi:hypothetical protein